MQNITSVTCKVCGGSSVFLCETKNEHSKTNILDNYRCQTCGLVFIGNSIEAEELGVAYASLDTSKYYEEIETENTTKMFAALQNLKNILPLSSRIIDIGTGDGQFVRILDENSFTDISAHEIPGADLKKIEGIASQIYGDFDYSSIPSDSFDAVTLLDVAEHVIDPHFLFESCRRILKKDGIIYFHTPVVTKTDRLMHFVQKIPGLGKIGRIWQRGRTSIFHLQNYTEKSLTLLLQKCGFKDIDIDIKNELSWPIKRYVRVYLLEKQGLPGFLAPIFVPFFYPLLATNLLNANKSIVIAKKA